jgi:hypothetical protein
MTGPTAWKCPIYLKYPKSPGIIPITKEKPFLSGHDIFCQLTP